jgi:hypothetical protein
MTFETIELTDDVRGGQTGFWDAGWGERYRRMNAFGRCQNIRYANSRTGNRRDNPSWPCSDFLSGKRPLSEE